MSLRCRKGDLAIIVRGRRVGHVVTVTDYYRFTPEYGHEWKIETSFPLPLLCDFWFCPDSWLLPIRPSDLQETNETEREVTV
jgi:hypothetical protein